MNLADVLLLLVYGGVFVYFLRRWLLLRRWPSLGVALLPSGWIVLALDDSMRTAAVVAIKWAGIGAGVLLLALVLQADRRDQDRT